VISNGRPCSDEELDRKCDDELESDDMSTQYNHFNFFCIFRYVRKMSWGLSKVVVWSFGPGVIQLLTK
jgi:hypothetical protein